MNNTLDICTCNSTYVYQPKVIPYSFSDENEPIEENVEMKVLETKVQCSDAKI